MSSESKIWLRLKIFAGVEVVAFLIALAIPVTPSKTGKPFHWPASWGQYFNEVLLAFLLGNALLLLIFVVSWIYFRSTAKELEVEKENPTRIDSRPHAGGQLNSANENIATGTPFELGINKPNPPERGTDTTHPDL